MSDLTKVLKGELDIPGYITKEAAAFTANPFLKAAASILLPLYVPQLMKMLGVTSTSAYAIVAAIEAGVTGVPVAQAYGLEPAGG